MIRVLKAQEARLLDKYMIEETGQSGMLLMENAAQAVFNEILKLDVHEPVLILCGTGNNGGDGCAIYRKLLMHGIPSTLVYLSDPTLSKGDARLNFNIINDLGYEYVYVKNSDELNKTFHSKNYTVIVDAMFGTGLKKEVEGLYAEAVELSNSSCAYRMSVDIPTGIESDTGRVLGVAFSAHKTVTFQTIKPAHLLLPGREYTGKLVCAPIGLDRGHNFSSERFMLVDDDIKKLLPKRPLDSHKGDNGRVLLIAGSDSMPGAAVMAASSILRTGAGLLKVCAYKASCSALNARLPEAMTHCVDSWESLCTNTLDELIDWADVLAIGPGMGRDSAVADIVKRALDSHKPMVIDADGLNALSKARTLLDKLHENVIITPHPGEMSRLSGEPIDAIVKDPENSALSFASKYGVNVLLKGAATVIAGVNSTIFYNITGNPGLAKGGSGDVLTGIIAALLAQKTEPLYAAALGAFILGRAAENAVKERGERSILPTDVVNAIKIC